MPHPRKPTKAQKQKFFRTLEAGKLVPYEAPLLHGGRKYDPAEVLIQPAGNCPQGELFPGYNPFEGISVRDYYFDVKAAQFVLSFFEVVLTIVEGEKAGEPFILEPWQITILANLFGWKRRKDHRRRYRQLFLYVPRKNGKTPFVAGIVLFCLFMDKEKGAQIYSAASDADQAAVIFNHASCMVHSSPALLSRSRVYRGFKAIELKERTTRNIFKALSSNAAGTHGKNIHVAVIEELHAHPDAELTEGLETGHGSRKQPLTIYVTTADYSRISVCNSRLALATSVRDDPKHSKRGTLLPIIYETPRMIDGVEVDWKCPEIRKAVNPNLGVSVEPEFLDDEKAKAEEDPDFVNTYKRLYLNQKTESAVRWLNMEHWSRCPIGYARRREILPSPHYLSADQSDLSNAFDSGSQSSEDLPSLEDWRPPKINDHLDWRKLHVPPRELLHPHRREDLLEWINRCPSWFFHPDRTWYAGMDLSSSEDITSLCLFSPQKNPWTGAYPCVPFFWLPRDNARKREKKIGVPYPTWIDQGLLWSTQGEFIDLDEICRETAMICDAFFVRGIAADRWGDRDAQNRLTGHGITCERYAQGYTGMNEPCRTLVRLLGQGKIEHGDNPILRWMAGNVVRTEDRDGRIRPDKKTSGEKIDGIIALLMGMGYSLVEAISIYSIRGVISLDGEGPKSPAMESVDPFDPQTWDQPMTEEKPSSVSDRVFSEDLRETSPPEEGEDITYVR